MPGRVLCHKKNGFMAAEVWEHGLCEYLERQLTAWGQADLLKNARSIVVSTFKQGKKDLIDEINYLLVASEKVDDPLFTKRLRSLKMNLPSSLDELRHSLLELQLQELLNVRSVDAVLLARDLVAVKMKLEMTGISSGPQASSSNGTSQNAGSKPISRSEPASRTEQEISYTSAFPALLPKGSPAPSTVQRGGSHWEQRVPLATRLSLQTQSLKNSAKEFQKPPNAQIKKFRGSVSGKENAVSPADFSKKKHSKGRDSRNRRDSVSPVNDFKIRKENGHGVQLAKDPRNQLIGQSSTLTDGNMAKKEAKPAQAGRLIHPAHGTEFNITTVNSSGQQTSPAFSTSVPEGQSSIPIPFCKPSYDCDHLAYSLPNLPLSYTPLALPPSACAPLPPCLDRVFDKLLDEKPEQDITLSSCTDFQPPHSPGAPGSAFSSGCLTEGHFQQNSEDIGDSLVKSCSCQSLDPLLSLPETLLDAWKLSALRRGYPFGQQSMTTSTASAPDPFLSTPWGPLEQESDYGQGTSASWPEWKLDSYPLSCEVPHQQRSENPVRKIDSDWGVSLELWSASVNVPSSQEASRQQEYQELDQEPEVDSDALGLRYLMLSGTPGNSFYPLETFKHNSADSADVDDSIHYLPDIFQVHSRKSSPNSSPLGRTIWEPVKNSSSPSPSPCPLNCPGACNCATLKSGGQRAQSPQPASRSSLSPEAKNMTKSASDSQLYLSPRKGSAFRRNGKWSSHSVIGPGCLPRVLGSGGPLVRRPVFHVDQASEVQRKQLEENLLAIIRESPDQTPLSAVSKEEFISGTTCPPKMTYEEKSWKELAPLTMEDMKRDYMHALAAGQDMFPPLPAGIEVSVLEREQAQWQYDQVAANLMKITEHNSNYMEFSHRVHFTSDRSTSLHMPQDETCAGFFPLSLPMVYEASVLERIWLQESLPNHGRKQGKNKDKGRRPLHPNKPCSFFLEGCCYRNDCKYSHDLSTITCHFWEEGECFKGDLCPFLHGYYRGRKGSDDDVTFDIAQEDFPALSRKQDPQLTGAPAPKRRKNGKKNGFPRTQLHGET